MKVKLLTRVFGTATVLGAMALCMALSATADVPATVDAYAGIAYAAGVHAIYYNGSVTSDLPNGAADNRYPMTSVFQDASPASTARASTEDGGAGLATLYALGKIPYQFPYASAQYPPIPSAPADSVCNSSGGGGIATQTQNAAQQQPNKQNNQQCQSGTAEAKAHELNADATGTYSGSFNTAAPTIQNATAESHTIVNPDGSEVVKTHSHVSDASFAGLLDVKNTDVVTTVTSADNVGKATDTVAPGTVTFAPPGQQPQPVQVTDKGVTLGPVSVPTSGLGTGSSVSSVTFKVFTVEPETSHSGARATIIATGTHVVVSQTCIAGNCGTVYPNRVEYIFGEGEADGFAIPAQPPAAATTDLSLFPGGNSLGYVGQPASTTTTYVPPAAVASVPSAIVTPPKRTTPRRASIPRVNLASFNRPNLALLFFAWEALLLATAGTIVWQRRAHAAAAGLG